jgi:hypothetical protein
MRVRITGNHEHAGEPLQIGEEYDLPASAARFAIRCGNAAKPSRKKKDAETDQSDRPADEGDSEV